jgi:F0F1-type ATP synthase assembly protein I
VKLLTPRRPINEIQQSGQTLGRGMDFALVVAVFFGVGWLLDRVLGTSPWCTVALVIIGFVGQFVKMYYEYSATMERLEAARASKATAHHTAGNVSTASAAEPSAAAGTTASAQ